MQPLKLTSAWIPTLAGIILLATASRADLFASVVAALPAALLITGGGRMLLSPDLRGPQHVAIGSVLGILVALPLGLIGGSDLGLTALLLSVAALLDSGWYQIRMQPVLDEVPAPAPSLPYCARVALDNAMLGPFALMTPLSETDELNSAVAESETAYALFRERGWLDDPGTYHPAPPPLESVRSTPLRIGRWDCEALSFESGFEPPTDVPGRDRWLAHANNQTAHALVLRRNRPGPWLIFIHGFGMGDFKQNFRAFRAGQLHESAGINVALFVLPVHGARSPGGFNGRQFFGLSPLDFVHAESQAIWDLRRLIDWIRRQGATQVGLSGLSLGGYTSALLASIEDGLDCVIAGVPPTDVLNTGEILSSSIERRIPAAAGVDLARDRAIQRVVSPLAMPCRVAHGGRYIFAATGDQFVPIEQVRALWQHWERPRICWCTGSHVSALMQRGPRDLVDEAIAATFGTAGK